LYPPQNDPTRPPVPLLPSAPPSPRHGNRPHDTAPTPLAPPDATAHPHTHECSPADQNASPPHLLRIAAASRSATVPDSRGQTALRRRLRLTPPCIPRQRPKAAPGNVATEEPADENSTP